MGSLVVQKTIGSQNRLAMLEFGFRVEQKRLGSLSSRIVRKIEQEMPTPDIL